MDFQKNHPSVKLHQAPGKPNSLKKRAGGQSNFSLGWGDDSAVQPKKQQQVSQSPWATEEEVKQAPATSVKVHHAPGGASAFSLADGSNTSSFQTTSQAAAQQATGGVPAGVPAAQQVAAGKTAVKVHQPPGGRSQITF